MAVLRGSPFSSYNFGEIWHLLDRQHRLPHTILDVGSFASLDLDDYDTIVLPDSRGNLGVTLGSSERIQAWVRGGGVLVAIGASASYASRSLLDLNGNGANPEPAETPASELTWDERRARAQEDRIPGSILRATVDVSHPLAAGVPAGVGVLKRGDRTLPVGDRGYVLARFDEDPRMGGLASGQALDRVEGTPFMTQHEYGSGHFICFSDVPTTRGFTHSTMRLLLNAILIAPSL